MLELTSGNVKAAMSEAGAKSSDLWMVPLENIRVIDGFNVRERTTGYEAHIIDIGESILANGYRKDKPLTGYVGKDGESNIIYVTDGHSRLEAVAYANSKGAEIKVLPVVTTPPGTSMEDLTVGLFTSNSGRPLSVLEKGEGCKRLIGYGMEPAEIAKKIGLTTGYVNDLLLLVSAPKKLRVMVASDEVSAVNAIAAIKKHGTKATEHLSGHLDAAKAAGKTKVTKKTLAPKRDLLADGVAWIGGKEPDGAEVDLIALLAFITRAKEAAIAESVNTYRAEHSPVAA